MTFQYICRSLIATNVGYGHFCQTAHCQHQNCSKCPLYTNSKEDDIRATKEAGEKVAKEIAENTAQGVNVDVDALLKNADKASPRRNGYPAMPAPPPCGRSGRDHRRASTWCSSRRAILSTGPSRRCCWNSSSCILSCGRRGWASSWDGGRWGR